MLKIDTTQFKYNKFRYYELSFFILFSIVFYFPIFFGRPFWDDYAFIFANSRMEMIADSPWHLLPGGWASKSWPIFYGMMWGMFHIFKTHFWLYHFASISLHGVNCFLIYRLLKHFNIRNYFILSLFFLVHPSQLFVIGWIIQFKTILSMFFFLIMVNMLIKYYNRFFTRDLLLSYFFFTLSIFSKSTTATFAGFLFIAFPYLSKPLGTKNYLLKILLPFCLLSGISIFRTALPFHLYKYFDLNKIEKININPAKLKPKEIEKFDSEKYRIETSHGEADFSNLPVPISREIIYSEINVQKAKEVLNFEKNHLNPGEQYFNDLSFFDKFVLTTKSFFRYHFYLFFPNNINYIFHEKTNLNYFSYEFLELFIGLILIYHLLKFLYFRKLFTEMYGYLFWLCSLLPFCGLVSIPIFSFSNFIPYWLTIPLIGILPLISRLIPSTKVLSAFVVVFALYTHYESYSFLHPENFFKQAIIHSPKNEIYRIALIEQYTNELQCSNAEKVYSDFKENEFTRFFCLELKIKNCKKKQSLKHDL
jgi:hypothetical protein